MRRIIFSPAISNKHIHTKIYIPTNTRARLLKFYQTNSYQVFTYFFSQITVVNSKIDNMSTLDTIFSFFIFILF